MSTISKCFDECKKSGVVSGKVSQWWHHWNILSYVSFIFIYHLHLYYMGSIFYVFVYIRSRESISYICQLFDINNIV